MDLDLTFIDNIPYEGAKEDFKETLEPKRVYTPQKGKKRNTGQNTGLYGDIARENTKKAGTLRAEILKDLGAGKAPLDILLKALDCISRMTGDSTLYDQGKEDIRTIYGRGLQERAPLEQELKEARERLARLNRAELRQTVTADEEQRLKGAIRAHQELIAELEQAIKSSRG